MRRTYERGTKARPSFSGGPAWRVVWKKWMSVLVYCALFRTPSFRKSLKFLGTPIASLDQETVQLSAFFILSAMFTGVCGPPEKLSLALAPRLYVLRMITRLFVPVWHSSLNVLTSVLNLPNNLSFHALL